MKRLACPLGFALASVVALSAGCGPPATPETTLVDRLREENAVLRQQNGELRRSLADTSERLRGAQLVLSALEGSGCDSPVLVPGPPVPTIGGHLLDVDGATPQAWVRLDVGADDRLEVGYHLSVYRGGQFVGKVVVEAPLRRDDARARVLFVADGQRFQAGDAAATRLQ